MNKIYRQQVELLLRIIPTLEEVDSFAIHGGTAINLYILDLPRQGLFHFHNSMVGKLLPPSTVNTHGICLM
jgi:hypothetical protein